MSSPYRTQRRPNRPCDLNRWLPAQEAEARSASAASGSTRAERCGPTGASFRIRTLGPPGHRIFNRDRSDEPSSSPAYYLSVSSAGDGCRCARPILQDSRVDHLNASKHQVGRSFHDNLLGFTRLHSGRRALGGKPKALGEFPLDGQQRLTQRGGSSREEADRIQKAGVESPGSRRRDRPRHAFLPGARRAGERRRHRTGPLRCAAQHDEEWPDPRAKRAFCPARAGHSADLRHPRDGAANGPARPGPL